MRLTTLPTDPPLDPRREPEPLQRPAWSPGRVPGQPSEGGPSPEGSFSERLVEALAAGVAGVRARIAAATPAGQPAPALLAVTKTVAPDTALALAGLLLAERSDAGPTSAPVELGESRAADLAAKAQCFLAAGVPARWHFLGHVQRNKARRIAQHADVIQSLDSLPLAEALERAAAEANKVLDVFVQVDFTGEATKTGLDAAGAREVLRFAAGAPHLRPLGLMAMGPLRETPGHTTSEVFARVVALARELEADPALAAAFPGGRAQLSLGMSGDLEVAIAAGSTLVRVGSDLFQHLGPAAPPLDPGDDRTP